MVLVSVMYISAHFSMKPHVQFYKTQAGAELGQAQVQLKVVVVVVLEDRVEVGVEVEVKDEDQLLVQVGGWWIKRN